MTEILKYAGPKYATGSQVAAGSLTQVYVSPGTIGLGLGAAKAWVYSNISGTISINDSYNTTSITTSSTDITWNFTTSFQNGSYSWAGTIRSISGVEQSLYFHEHIDSVLRSGSQFRLYVLNNVGTPISAITSVMACSLMAVGLQ